MQVLGLCRFSYLSVGGFKLARSSLAEQRAFLYDPGRLKRRFTWFREVTLPALKAQSDADFTLLLLTGQDFPEIEKLQETIADLPQIRLVQQEPGPHREICSAVIKAHVDPLADGVAQFRLDDDDAVAVDFVARVRSDHSRLIAPLMAATGRPVVLDYSFGVTLDLNRQGQLGLYPQISHQHPAGLVLFAPSGFRNSVMSFGHHKLNHSFPMLSLADQVMFLRGRHGENDSGDAVRIGAPVDLPMPAARLFRQRFGIDFVRLQQELESLAQ